MTVMCTVVEKKFVRYEVVNAEGEIVWSETVYFDTRRTHQVGGYAFLKASREQEIVAGVRRSWGLV